MQSNQRHSLWECEERYARLVELWSEPDPLSSEQMADLLSWEWQITVGKNALLGKLWRNGKVRHSTLKPFVPVPEDFLPGPGECSYPNGHPDEPDFHYCKAPAMLRSPYCAEHHALCWVKRKKRDEERIAA